jgi:hypothetical protein
MPAEGGDTIQVTANGGYVAFESIDGTSLYYAKRPIESTLWTKPRPSGSRFPCCATMREIRSRGIRVNRVCSRESLRHAQGFGFHEAV